MSANPSTGSRRVCRATRRTGPIDIVTAAAAATSCRFEFTRKIGFASSVATSERVFSTATTTAVYVMTLVNDAITAT